MASGFRWRGGNLTREIVEMDARLHAGISAAVEMHATEGTGYAKSNARWTDRTTAARNGLHHNTVIEFQQWAMVFAHAVNYGIWLETRRDFNGQYAIIMETVRFAGERLMQTLDMMLRKI